MQEIFKTAKSKDSILAILIKKSHKAILKLVSVDLPNEHLNLVTEVCTSLKNDDIKWVEITLDFQPTIPANTIYYINKFNNNFVCHIEDFERFYLDNVKKIIKPTHIHFDLTKVSDDGWVKVSSPKHEKKEKYDNLMAELSKLVGDWNELL